jgi:molybdate transport system substrate-binding protein
MSQPLYLLSGGAAYGLVSTLEGRFKADTGYTIAGTFSAVGAMRDQLLAGAACDLLILTATLITQLQTSGHVLAGSERALGTVKTGIAVQTGEPAPSVATPDELKAALLNATGIYFPDPVKATAGIHFMSVLKQLGIVAQVASRLRPFPNGASAMSAMAQSSEAGLIGCTQCTEILYTAGVALLAPLPKAFELATVYTAGVSATTGNPPAAAALIAMLTSPQQAELRQSAGFEE